MNQQVRQEIDNIRKYATKAQKNKLNVMKFMPNNMFRCIYGLMTGSCYSEDAKKLMIKCGVFKDDDMYYAREFTPLEKYVMKVSKRQGRIIIAYIKGETDIL